MDRVRSRKGFTLIELIVVIMIIGIIAAVAATAFSKFNGKTCHRDAETRIERCHPDALPQG